MNEREEVHDASPAGFQDILFPSAGDLEGDYLYLETAQALGELSRNCLQGKGPMEAI